LVSGPHGISAGRTVTSKEDRAMLSAQEDRGIDRPTAGPQAMVSNASRDTAIPSARPGLPQFKLRRVTEYIKSNLSRPVRLAELGAVIHMSPYHFARLFKLSTGVSPHQFLLRERMEHAAALLAAPGSLVGAVARSVGFRTSAHFATTFRRMTGVTPTMYRTVAAPRRHTGPAPGGVGRHNSESGSAG
jgi:AraC-like DNA-binding protein